MTEVAGTVKQVGQGLTQKTYNYDALDSLVDIITNSAGTFRASLRRFRPQINVLRRPTFDWILVNKSAIFDVVEINFKNFFSSSNNCLMKYKRISICFVLAFSVRFSQKYIRAIDSAPSQQQEE